MRRGSGTWSGYTIVEVMIFLAISGVLFIIAAGFISGKQANTEFSQGVNIFETFLRTTINNVNNGYYPSYENFGCTAVTGGSNAGPQFQSTSTAKGANNQCIYIGQVVQFKPGGDTGKYAVFPVAGNRLSSSLEPVDSLDKAFPVPLATATPDTHNGARANMLELSSLPYGLRLKEAYVMDHSTLADSTRVTSFGIFTTFAGINSGGSLESGSLSISVTSKFSKGALTDTSTNTSLARSTGQMAYMVTGIKDSNVLKTSSSVSNNVVLCLEGSNGHLVTMTITPMGRVTSDVTGEQLCV